MSLEFSKLQSEVVSYQLAALRSPTFAKMALPKIAEKFCLAVRSLDAANSQALIFAGISASGIVARLTMSYVSSIGGKFGEEISFTEVTSDEEGLLSIIEMLEVCSAWLSKSATAFHQRRGLSCSTKSGRTSDLREQLAKCLTERSHPFFAKRLSNPKSDVSMTLKQLLLLTGFDDAEAKGNCALGESIVSNSILVAPVRYIIGLGNNVSEQPYAMLTWQDDVCRFATSRIMSNQWAMAASIADSANKTNLKSAEFRKRLESHACPEVENLDQIETVRNFTKVPFDLLYPNLRIVDHQSARRPEVKLLKRPLRLSFWTSYSGIKKRDGVDSAADELRTLENLAERGQCHLKVFEGEECTRQNFLQQRFQNTDVLHLSTHGIGYPGLPALTHLQMTNSGNTDSIHYCDILSLDLNQVKVAILNCCFTKFGAPLFGTDSQSLAYAFLSSGVEHVVATKWPLHKLAASEFTRHFYAAFAEERSVQEAYFSSIEKMRRHSETCGWAFWGAYSLLS